MSTPVIDPNKSPDASSFQEHFVVAGKLLTGKTGVTTYKPNQIEIISYFRLNGKSHSEENVIVYLIETFDGRKGTLLYRFDVFTDCIVYNFLREYVDYKT